MEENTNAIAFNQLRPIVNNDIGAIVEEHTRYWRNKKDSEEAARKAQAAQAAKFKAARNKEAFELYEGLSPEENRGFLNSQIVENFQKNKSRYRDLAIRYRDGDLQAGILLQEEKEKIANVVKLNKTYGDKAQELALQESQGLGNKYLDESKIRLRDSFTSGKYKINSDWSLDYFNPNSTSVERMNTSELFNNDYLSSTLNKKADFTGNGADIAKNLLDKNDGNSVADENTKVEGIRLVKSLFGQDDVEARSWYGNVVEQGLADFKDSEGNVKPFGSLDQFERNKLADLYYQNNVEPNISETTVDTGLEDAIKSERLAKLRKERKEADSDNTTITASTDEVGNILNQLNVDVPFVASEGDRVFNLKGNPISFGVKGNSNTNITYTDLIKTEDGKVFAVGKQVEKVSEPVLDVNGDPIETTSGQKTKIVEKSVDVIEFDPRVINNISRLIEDGNGNSFDNLNQLSNFLDKETDARKTTSENTEQPVKFN